MQKILEKPEYSSPFLLSRPRRNRKTKSIRNLIQENHLRIDQLISPLFVLEGKDLQDGIPSMPEVHRYSLDLLIKKVESLSLLGIGAINLFPVIPIHKKDALGTEAINPENLLCEAITTLKKEFPELTVIVDIALDPYTDHGHDGVINQNKEIDNDATLAILAKMSLLAAHAGADIVAPSDMMDGRVGHIREKLDQNGFSGVSILSYTAKYASSLYSPFRDALGSSPKFGDKKTYQMNPANRREALREAYLDAQEGADFLLVKPALSYLDVILEIKKNTEIPVVAYHVSGEYSMVMAAHERGWLNATQVFYEHLLSIKRAGADAIMTYAAEKIALFLKQVDK